MTHEYDSRVRMGQGQWYYDRFNTEERLAAFQERRRARALISDDLAATERHIALPASIIRQSNDYISYNDSMMLLSSSSRALSANDTDDSLGECRFPVTWALNARACRRTVATIEAGPNRLRPARSTGEPVCWFDTVRVRLCDGYLTSQAGQRGRGTPAQSVFCSLGVPCGDAEWVIVPGPGVVKAAVDGLPVPAEADFMLVHGMTGRILGDSGCIFHMVVSCAETEACCIEASKTTAFILHTKYSSN